MEEFEFGFGGHARLVCVTIFCVWFFGEFASGFLANLRLVLLASSRSMLFNFEFGV